VQIVAIEKFEREFQSRREAFSSRELRRRNFGLVVGDRSKIDPCSCSERGFGQTSPFASDLNGTDPYIHDGKIEGVFRELCNIFTRSGGQPTTQLMWQVYREMRRNLPIILRQSGANSIFNTRVFKDLSVLASDCADRFVS